MMSVTGGAPFSSSSLSRFLGRFLERFLVQVDCGLDRVIVQYCLLDCAAGNSTASEQLVE